ncbi:DNA methyltransferase [Spirochaetia bacterium]|nr:DNA methyltransferase [Spirochaetia bacterium]
MTVPTREINQYLADIDSKYRQGNATEHSYRPALQALFESITTGLSITNEPTRIDCGAPDYIITRDGVPVGYIEAKDIPIGIHDKANKAQFDRYKNALNNLIITDYINFELFIDGDLRMSVTIGTASEKGIIANKEKFAAFAALIECFTSYEGKTITNSEQLAKMMAKKARLLSETIEQALPPGESELLTTEGDALVDQLKSFRHFLIHNLGPKEFADIFAQTIAYGMFAARLNDNSTAKFTRMQAAQNIPQSNPFLKDFFRSIAAFELDERIRWIVDALTDMFNCVAVEDLLKEFGKANQDPYIHFYETFLGEFDPTQRKGRGVWYTPISVVNFIVDAVDDILKTEFSLQSGLADKSKVVLPIIQDDGKPKDTPFHKVQILDPATGTGTFLAAVIDKIHEKYASNKGMWTGYCAEHLMPRINGFEILMASYAMAHFKLDMKLKETGYQIAKERLRVFLTNTLEDAPAKFENLPYARWLATESDEARKIKRDVPVMVVLGNPPYSGESSNKTADDYLAEYKKEPAPNLKAGFLTDKLQERNSKWINDDYVKFIRFGQVLVEKNNTGILAYINNHSFLDNPTFRGMRYNLLKAFDKIYILDLHGNAKKLEAAPDGGKDDNVFDIQQGVSINIFIKTEKKKDGGLARVQHFDLYGKRELKYQFLFENTLASVKWQDIRPQEPYFFFVNKDFTNNAGYEKGFSVRELFPVNVLGFQTHRDDFAIAIEKKDIVKRINDLLNEKLSDEEIHKKYNISDNKDWQLKRVRHQIKDDKNREQKVMLCNYRPFDDRYCYFDNILVDRPREEIMRNFIDAANVGLVVSRQQKASYFQHCLVQNKIVESCYVSNKTSEQGYSFPLYLCPEGALDPAEKRRPNLNMEIVDAIAAKTGLHFTVEKEDGPVTFAPIDILDYIYAVLYSPTYREKYREFLKIDFPRVPYPESATQFIKLAALGATLRKYHLLDGIEPVYQIAAYPIEGSNETEKLEYKENNVYINKTQYFQNVPTDAWNFFIGGYQPAQKWLKDRKGHILTVDEIEHYQKIIAALIKTYEIQGYIDEALN